MASWVDPVTGNQVVVESEAEAKVASSASYAMPSTTVGSSLHPVHGNADPRPESIPDILSLDDTDHIDVEDMDRELERRSGERFFVMPDGTGVVRTLTADQVDPALRKVDSGSSLHGFGEEPGEPVMPLWRACGAEGIKPGLVLRREKLRRHVLSFPAVERQSYRPGYALPIPSGTRIAAFSTVVQGGRAVHPLLVRLDTNGAVIAVAYSVATETVPESRFRYARVGFQVPIPSGGEGEMLALVDAASSRRFLKACGLEWQPADFAVPGSSGTVILEFSAGSGSE